MFPLDVIMSKDLVTIGRERTLDEARRLMNEHRIRHLPVVEDGDRLVGLLTQSDVLEATDSFLREADERLPDEHVLVEEVMVTRIATVGENASIREAALFLEKNKFGCLPVVTDGRLVGIVTDTDFVGVAINLLEQIEETEPVADEDL